MELLGDELEDLVGEGAEQVVLVEVADGAGRLRQEHVGRRVVALLGDQQGEVGRVAVAHLHVDAGLLGEAGEDRLDEVLRPTRVDDDGASVLVALAGGVRPVAATPGAEAIARVVIVASRRSRAQRPQTYQRSGNFSVRPMVLR